jgi:hypothetical protein
MFNILKWLGIFPAAGGLLDQLFDLQSMKTLNLLHGFGGVKPHIIGIICFGVARLAAANQNKHLPPIDADHSRTVWGWSAFFLFVVFLGLVSATLPEDLSPSLIEWRWWLAAVLYILFYAALGKSEPPL